MSNYLKLSEVTKGMTFYERGLGMWFELRALEDAHEVQGECRNGWEVRVECLDGDGGEEGTLFESHNAGAYALQLYRKKL